MMNCSSFFVIRALWDYLLITEIHSGKKEKKSEFYWKKYTGSQKQRKIKHQVRNMEPKTEGVVDAKK